VIAFCVSGKCDRMEENDPSQLNRDCHTEIEVALQAIQSFADDTAELEQLTG